MTSYDACVIGAGGIVGSAILRVLAQKGLSVIGLEKHNGPAHETSGHNSRVIHSGFHEGADTLKARLAPLGSSMLLEYARSNDVPVLQTGMLIAVPYSSMATAWREGGALWALWRGGRRHKIDFQWVLSPGAIRRIAPVRAIGGIFIPSVAVVDVFLLIGALQRDAGASGAEIRYGAEVTAIEIRDGFYVVTAGGQEIQAATLINSAGLGACSISVMAGGPHYEVEYIRGRYYELRGGVRRWQIRTLVYPVMPAGSKSKGIHLGPRTDGSLFIGPDAFPIQNNGDDATEQTTKALFLEAARKFLPDIDADDLLSAPSGIRPKFTRPDGISDFLIQRERGTPMLINLIGIDSPGLSSSMAIADYVWSLLQ